VKRISSKVGTDRPFWSADAARNLLDIARLRQQAQKLGIRKLEGMKKAA
jgi:transcription-repair coupling factor (superfamily II helicase)